MNILEVQKTLSLAQMLYIEEAAGDLTKGCEPVFTWLHPFRGQAALRDSLVAEARRVGIRRDYAWRRTVDAANACDDIDAVLTGVASNDERHSEGDLLDALDKLAREAGLTYYIQLAKDLRA